MGGKQVRSSNTHAELSSSTIDMQTKKVRLEYGNNLSRNLVLSSNPDAVSRRWTLKPQSLESPDDPSLFHDEEIF